MNPLVSILIPAYNAEETIAYTLQSAIAQTWQRKEIIVVDDGSKDRTSEMVRSFASKGVTVVSTENRGLCGGREPCFAGSAKGTTSKNWIRMIFWRQTKSSGSLRRYGKVTANGYFSPRRGRPFIIGLATLALFATPCGKTFLQSSGF